jgi:hypothetical protein
MAADLPTSLLPGHSRPVFPRGVGRYLVLILAILFAPLVSAESLTTQVSPRAGTIDDTFTLTITVRGRGEPTISSTPDSPDFAIRFIGPQTAIQIINGVFQQETSLLFEITPRRVGTLTVPSLEISIEGSRQKSEPLTVTVTAADPSTKSDDTIILEQSISSRTPFRGEQVQYQLTFLTQLPIAELAIPDLTFDQFWSIQPNENTAESTVRRGGKSYRSVAVRRILFPLTSGEITLPELTINPKVFERGSRAPFPPGAIDPFDIFANSRHLFGAPQRTRRRTVSAQPLPLSVAPLPPAPADIPLWDSNQPLVGPTSITATYDDIPIDSGQGKTITLTLTSEGNISSWKRPLIQSNSSFRVYEEAGQTATVLHGDKLVTQRTIPLTIVPLSGGIVTIPPVSISFFDPATTSYQVTTSQPITFEVHGRRELPTPPPSSTSQPTPQPSLAHETLQPTSVPVPTEAPADRYSPPSSSISDLFRHLGLPLALFLATASLCGIALLLFTTIRIRRNRPRSVAATKAEIASCQTINELSFTFGRILTALVQNGMAPPSGESLKALVRTTIHDPGLQFDLLTLIDDINTARFSRAEPHEREIVLMRDRALALVERVSRFSVREDDDQNGYL